jgi:hypothetical protein
MEERAWQKGIQEIADCICATGKLARSQVLLKEVERLEQAVTLTNKDIQQLRLAGDVLEDRTGKF